MPPPGHGSRSCRFVWLGATRPAYAAAILSVTMHRGENDAAQPPRIRRRDRHGRGVRGRLVPPGVPLYRTRSQQFDDMVLDAVARLESRWEAELAGVEFAVQEVPEAEELVDDSVPLPLARTVPGIAGARATPPARPRPRASWSTGAR